MTGTPPTAAATRSLVERIAAALRAWDLPVRCPAYDVEAVWRAMAHDKKRRGKALRWILPRAVGRVEIVDNVPPEVVKAVLRDLGARRDP